MNWQPKALSHFLYICQILPVLEISKTGREREREMAGMAAACSSGVMFRARESGSSRASLFQYRGLRPGENSMQMASASPRLGWFISSPGKCQSFSNKRLLWINASSLSMENPILEKCPSDCKIEGKTNHSYSISGLISIHQYIFMNVVIFQSQFFPPFLLKFLCMYWFYFLGKLYRSESCYSWYWMISLSWVGWFFLLVTFWVAPKSDNLRSC